MDIASIPCATSLPVSLWPNNRQVSQAGFGCYRIALGNNDHEQALEYALRSGINLIDTSTNYADGASEELVGTVVNRVAARYDIQRENLTIVTKVGYIQGTNYTLAKEREEMGIPFPEVVKYGKGLWHCIHPDFIDDQITRSLERLQTGYIDVLLLHNPEYFLTWAQKKQCCSREARAEFYRRIEQAFRHLEEEVQRGRIRSYGISSNTFPQPSHAPDFCSLETVWNIAQSLTPNNHFSLIQLPINLVERTAATERNQNNNTQTALEFAKEKQLVVLTNRPLNAMTKKRLIRLADIPCTDVSNEQEILSTIHNLIQLENAFYIRFLPQFDINEQDRAAIIDYLAPGTILQRHWNTFCSYEHWTEVRSQYFLPRMNAGLRAITPATHAGDLCAWIHEFKEQTSSLFHSISCFYAGQSRQRAAMVKSMIAAHLGNVFANMSLSQLAVNVLRATEGVTSVLVGMRQKNYVEDIVAGLQQSLPHRLHKNTWDSLGAIDTMMAADIQP